ncbi:actin-related protein 8 isoform X2 [Cryptomeria japonica]|uniref:actin-related protein 8 isoform X2 n=1 Tax=Cryptomeria japonica TaxID=3369 RepID=UPI0025AC37CD|nr:actin-related protein 8 isoform X2 [Cryptomeria japonica]
MLLRRVWNSLRKSSMSQNSEDVDSQELSPAENLSADVFDLILQRLGPRGSAKAAVICRTWRNFVEDERLWESFLREECGETWQATVFAETYLRAGLPLRSVIPGEFTHLPFREIYSQRAHVQRSVIIDGGSGYCKYGWSTNSGPSGRSATFLEFANIESPIHSRLKHFFSTIYRKLNVKPLAQPLVISTPICHCDDTQSAKAARQNLREAIYQVLFDMNVPAICAIDQAVLALYAAQQISGIVVNIGFQVTSIVPILCGKVMRNVGVELVGQGALRITGFLSELMHGSGIEFGSMYTVKVLKENLCYVAEDYHAELLKNTKSSHLVKDEGIFTLSHERFQATEILFQPQLGGIRAMSLHRAVALCIDHCHSFEMEKVVDEGWFKTVVLTGGTACLPGLADEYFPSGLVHNKETIPTKWSKFHPCHGS